MTKRAGRGNTAVESWRQVATDVRGGIHERSGHEIPEELAEWALQQLLEFFVEDEG